MINNKQYLWLISFFWGHFMDRKSLPVGIEDFEELQTGNYYFVDKTLLIKDLIDINSKVSLFTRPRRFGKTLNMSMMKYFFEFPVDPEQDKKHLFENLKIWQYGGKYQGEQGQYPVISISLREAEKENFEDSWHSVADELKREYVRHDYLLNSPKLSDDEKKHIALISELEKYTDKSIYGKALKRLSYFLNKHHSRKVIILIDEYDVPINKAYINGYYDDMISFIRGMLHGALKSNDSLHRGIMTGCLRVSKESIFTGLNNLKIVSILSSAYTEHYGFTQSEVNELLSFYNLESEVGSYKKGDDAGTKIQNFHESPVRGMGGASCAKVESYKKGDDAGTKMQDFHESPVRGMGGASCAKHDEVKKWYNGYRFGDSEIYNPWSIISYVDDHLEKRDNPPQPYWSNTSGNDIVKEIIEMSGETEQAEIETLISGGTIKKIINESVTYNEIKNSINNMWNFLFFTGYLTPVSYSQQDRAIEYTLKIPNEEVLFIYENTIREWFKEKITFADPSILLNALINKNINLLEEELNKRLMDIISYYDSAESLYHGFLLGILSNVRNFSVKSNRESGTGRSDIFMKDKGIRKRGIIFELKTVKDKDDPDEVCNTALKQIEEKGYAHDLEEEGYCNIIKYAIAFRGKECLIKAEIDS